ncbi:MAG: zinc carboxypeptidase, partial [Bacteroidota bacterium]
LTTSLSTLRAAHALRKELLNHQRDFFTSAIREAEQAPVKAYVVGTPSDPARNYHFLRILRQHQIEVYELARRMQADGKTFEPGSAYVVPTNQKQYRFLTALFERRTQFDDSLFYDISTWTLPLAFNLPYTELKSLSRDFLGKGVTAPAWPQGTIVAGSSPTNGAGTYAYVFEWSGYYAPRALYRLQRAGVKAKVATKPFEAATAEGNKKFDYGTILIPLGIQQEKADTVRKILDLIAREDGVRVYALTTGLSASGIDLGSPSYASLDMPRVALVVGPGVAFTDAGEIWHLLDQRFNMPVSLLENTALGRVDLTRYNTLALASGNYASIDSAGRENLRRWVGNGGTLIAMENAVEWAVENRLATAKFRTEEAPKKDTLVARRSYADEERHTRALGINGSIFEATLDRTHPLAFGYESDRLSIFRGTTVFMDPTRSPYASPVVYTANPLLSGYLHKQQEKHLKNSAAVSVSALRNGRVILMTDNPNFRAFWYGTNKLFLNGIFFGQTIRQSSARAEE